MHMPDQQHFAVCSWKRQQQQQQQQRQQQLKQHLKHQLQLENNSFKKIEFPLSLQHPLRRHHNLSFTKASMQQTSTSNAPRMEIKTENMQSLVNNTIMTEKISDINMGTATAVVVNSLIYAKPSFCGIVMAVGSSSITSGCFKQHRDSQQSQQKGSSEKQHQMPVSSSTEVPSLFNSFGCGYGGNLSYLLNGLKINDPSSILAKDKEKNDNDAELYMMCTTLNGSINHHISEFCENLLATMCLLDNDEINPTNTSGNVDNGKKEAESTDYKNEEEHEEETEIESETESETETESDSDIDDNSENVKNIEETDTSDTDSLIEFSYNDDGENQEEDIWSQVSEDDDNDDENDDYDEENDYACTSDNSRAKEQFSFSCPFTRRKNTFDGASKLRESVVSEHEIISLSVNQDDRIEFQCYSSFISRGADEVDFLKDTITSYKNKQSYNCDRKQRKVQFNMKPIIHVMHTWTYAYRAARKGHWETFVRDRERFKLRIQRVAAFIEPILKLEHRQHIFETRFAKLLLKEDKQQMLSHQENEKQQKRRKNKGKIGKHSQQKSLQSDVCKNVEPPVKSNNNSVKCKTEKDEMISNKFQKGPKIRSKTRQKQNKLSCNLCSLSSKDSLKNCKDCQGQQKTFLEQKHSLTPEMKNGCKVRHRMKAVIYYCNAF